MRKQIEQALGELEHEIEEKRKDAIIDLIAAELFSPLYYNSMEYTLSAQTSISGGRLFLNFKITIFSQKEIHLFQFRPFIDKCCGVKAMKGGAVFTKSYYLYHLNQSNEKEISS